MISPECNLRKNIISTDGYGVQRENVQETLIPIMKNEEIYSNEWYQANEQGYKLSLRLRISALNYDGQDELEYMGKIYTIVRVTNPNIDELVLLCELKAKNVQ